MILYLASVCLGLTLFWLYYILFLKRTTFFRANRYLLLGGLIFCFLVPFSTDLFSKTTLAVSFDNESVTSFYTNPVIQQVGAIKQEISKITTEKVAHYSWLTIGYFAATGLLLLRLLWGIFSMWRFSSGSSYPFINGKKVYQNDTISQPFSFFRSIHILTSWQFRIPKDVLTHEEEHVDHWHFVDLLVAELACIVLWFNPIMYLYKMSIRLNLEYLADQRVMTEVEDVYRYQSTLLSMALKKQTYSPLIINLTTPLKNRIEMMNKEKSSSWKSIALIGIVPLAIGLTALNKKEEIRIHMQNATAPVLLLVKPEVTPSGYPIKSEDRIRVASGFGERYHPVRKVNVFHTGIDITAKSGTPVYATADGLVEMAQYDEKKGYFVKLNHSDQYQTQYSHLKSFIVLKGTTITKGQLIGYVGSTGISTAPHLHYEVHEYGEAVDPKKFMDDC